jgi:cytochrome c-type biogenesis protein
VIAALPSSLIAAIPVAIAAGVVAFASPCVVPLVPGYIAFLSGAVGHLEAQPRRGRALTGAVAFVLGFTIVFVSEGALFGAFGAQLREYQRPIQIAFGIVTIALGLFFAGWLPSAWLEREARWHAVPSATVAGAVSLGFLFGLGWSPCIGPTLASILVLAGAASDATAMRGSILAFFYCVGLGLPFLLFALLGDMATKSSDWLRRHRRAVSVVGGVLLIGIGVAELTGQWQHWVTWLKDNLPATPSL